ncbi:MAG: hypothetical protein WCG27_12325, partial [Pseudomonadota bacterium]
MNLDTSLNFISMLYATCFLILAGVSWNISHRDKEIPWNYLAAFALIYGIKQCADYLADDFLSTFRAYQFVRIAAYSCLFEFGRRILAKFKKVPGPWIIVVP